MMGRIAVLTKEIKQALKQLGANKYEVKDHLLKHDCKGIRKMCHTCPVARYLNKVTSVKNVYVYHPAVYSYEGIGVELPAPVRELIEEFDAGMHPELRLEGTI